jgi:uncharacterized protein (DUF2141 family)
MKKIIPLFIIFLSGTLFLNAQNSIEVEIHNFKSNKGQALVGLYNSEDSFLKEEYKGKIVKISNKKAVLTFDDLPDGNYAVTVIHDEDGNEDLTTNFLGIPKESIGASNDAPARFGPPKWKDAMFEVRNGKTLKKKINLK